MQRTSRPTPDTGARTGRSDRAPVPRRRRRHPAPAEGGSTLIEVVIAVAILTTIALGSLLVLVPIVQQTRLNHEVATATAEVGKVLERIQSAPFSEITTLYPDGTTLPTSGLENGTVTVTYLDPTADPLFVQVTISWQSSTSGSFARTFTTVRTE